MKKKVAKRAVKKTAKAAQSIGHVNMSVDVASSRFSITVLQGGKTVGHITLGPSGMGFRAPNQKCKVAIVGWLWLARIWKTWSTGWGNGSE